MVRSSFKACSRRQCAFWPCTSPPPAPLFFFFIVWVKRLQTHVDERDNFYSCPVPLSFGSPGAPFSYRIRQNLPSAAVHATDPHPSPSFNRKTFFSFSGFLSPPFLYRPPKRIGLRENVMKSLSLFLTLSSRGGPLRITSSSSAFC